MLIKAACNVRANVTNHLKVSKPLDNTFRMSKLTCLNSLVLLHITTIQYLLILFSCSNNELYFNLRTPFFFSLLWHVFMHESHKASCNNENSRLFHPTLNTLYNVNKVVRLQSV